MMVSPQRVHWVWTNEAGYTEVKNAWSYTSKAQQVSVVWCVIKVSDFTFFLYLFISTPRSSHFHFPSVYLLHTHYITISHWTVCVDKPIRCTNSYKWYLFFIVWLYMFRTITSPSSGAPSSKLYHVFGKFVQASLAATWFIYTLQYDARCIQR